ncbi:MAG: hypothetical protein Q4C64_05845 [Erysipelotrichia bacterium]|nr:hypothetical protein [Erysipelotrichia bacterium]
MIRKSIIIFLVITLLILTGCMSDKDKAIEYVKNNEYKEAYELLYDMGEDHTQADDCLVRWCKYCIEQSIVDPDLKTAKFIYRDNAEKIYKIIERRMERDNLSTEKNEIILQVVGCIEDFYPNDKMIKLIKDNGIIQDYLDNDQYCQAYNFAYDLDEDHTRAKNCLIEWYKYCIDNEKLDEELSKIGFIDFDIVDKVFELVIDYLYDKEIPTKDEADFALSILSLLEEPATENDNIWIPEIIRSLKHTVKGEYIWTVPQWTSLPYDEYYETVHYYDESSRNGYDLTVHAQFGTYGIVVAILDPTKDINNINENVNYNLIDNQYILFGDLDYNEYTFLEINNGVAEYGFDGYWFYYLNTDEPSLNRINIYGETEKILTKDDLTNKSVEQAFVLDHDILYAYIINDDNTITIYRVYLPSKTIEKYRINVTVYTEFKLLVPPDSQHLSYSCANLEYVEKIQE